MKKMRKDALSPPPPPPPTARARYLRASWATVEGTPRRGRRQRRHARGWFTMRANVVGWQNTLKYRRGAHGSAGGFSPFGPRGGMLKRFLAMRNLLHKSSTGCFCAQALTMPRWCGSAQIGLSRSESTPVKSYAPVICSLVAAPQCRGTGGSSDGGSQVSGMSWARDPFGGSASGFMGLAS